MGQTLKAASVLISVFVVALAVVPRADGQAQARKVRVAAAADLNNAMVELAAAFEKQSGTKIDVTYGSSGTFLSQIENGAPFDLFFSADMAYPRRLVTEGLAEPGTLYSYAVGQIVIWMPAESRADVAKLGWDALLNSGVQKIAVANPDHAPYGRAAVAALQNAGIYEQVRAKLVYGENISQAAQFVKSGNAQAGIVALSLALSPEMKDGKRWLVPPETHPPIEQGTVLLKGGKNKESAEAFLEFVKSAKGHEVLAKFGFVGSPETSK